MCGIAGIITLQPGHPARPQMLDIQQHRGPDGVGEWTRAASSAGLRVWLGHRRLAIIDLSAAAAQPMASADGRLHLTYNGEIYNYVELMAELQALGHVFRSRSDSEVILCAYEQWGEACVARFNGMFAFALWDEGRQELFAARDRFGEKPFHYAWDHTGWFAFSSEIKALVSLPEVDAGIDERALYRFAAFRELAGSEQTLWRGVKRLPCAHSLRLRWNGDRLTVALKRYWDIDLERTTDEPLEVTSKRFAELFADSVRLRLRSDVPVGTSLSGGLDSSAVVCQMHALDAREQNSFSARMPDPALDEGRYIEAVVAHTGIRRHEVWPTPEAFSTEFSRLCYHQEEPFQTTSQFAQYLVMGLARERDVTVLLDGQGADELLAGYTAYFRIHYASLAARWQLFRLLAEKRAFAARHAARFPLSAGDALARAFPAVHRGYRSLNGRTTAADTPPVSSLFAWCDRDWTAAFRTEEPVAPRASSRDALTRHLYADALQGPLQELLRYGDRNSMAFSREVRQPFLDHRIAELAFALPSEQKLGNGQTKVVLRSGLGPLLPPAVRARQDKLGYQAPLATWFDGALRGWVTERIDAARHSVGAALRRDAVDVVGASGARVDPQTWRSAFSVVTLAECLREVSAARASR